MNKIFKLFIVVFLSLVAITASSGVVLANDEEAVQEGVLRPEIGPQIEGFTPGVGGYKIFGPNAIKTLIPERIDDSNTPRTEMVWTASTDIWESGGPSVMGSHTSESTLYIEEIWVDGAIRMLPYSWYDQDDDHTSGMIAWCSTQMPDPNFWQDYEAKSWHHFDADGYAPWNPITADYIET